MVDEKRVHEDDLPRVSFTLIVAAVYGCCDVRRLTVGENADDADADDDDTADDDDDDDDDDND
jgi:hypothetical protein